MERQHIGRYLVHQVRNSITPIRLCTNVIKNNPAKSEESLQIIEHETDKIETLIRRFRSLYAFPGLSPGRTEINTLIGKLLLSYPEVRFRQPEGKVYVEADAQLLEQALRNLIDNALEASREREHPEVTVTLSELPEISIKDNGAGIPAELRDSIFEEYVTTKQQGMGIGLSFVQKVCSLHRFPLAVYSEEGRGSEFVIILREEQE